jgi:hypothetical protein
LITTCGNNARRAAYNLSRQKEIPYMSKTRITLRVLTFMVFTLALGSLAQAQATRTWVSGVGDDVNPCSRTAPCKTFAGAISKTAAGGEISVLDPGGYGTLTVTKSITVDGGTGAGWGSVLAALTTGFIINDSLSGSPNTIVVHLRNLSINGANNGTDGIRVINAAVVHVEKVNIFRFTGDGIEMAYTGAAVGRLNVKDVTISECGGSAVLLGGTQTSAHAVQLDGMNIFRNGHGIRVNNRAVVAVSNSVLSANNASPSSTAVLADSAVAGGAVINLESCQVNLNSVGVQANTNQTIRLSNTYMTANGNALNFTGGIIASFGNNKIQGNAAGEAFASLTDVLQQ